jgi:hypothetical protein
MKKVAGILPLFSLVYITKPLVPNPNSLAFVGVLTNKKPKTTILAFVGVLTDKKPKTTIQSQRDVTTTSLMKK